METVGKIEWVKTDKIKPNPKNPNKHPKGQIDHLVKQLEYQGFRLPLIISNQSGLLVVGHGRLKAAKKLNLDKIPILYQDFKSEDHEYAFMIADNAVAAQSELDLSLIHKQLADINLPDIDLLAIEGFEFEPIMDPEKPEPKTCPHCGEPLNAKEKKTRSKVSSGDAKDPLPF